MLVESETPVLTSLGAYPTVNVHVAGHAGRLVTVPYAGDREDPDVLLEAARRERSPLSRARRLGCPDPRESRPGTGRARPV